ncbi:hypothetical protein Tco_0327600 [Tanacetum coccineum]
MISLVMFLVSLRVFVSRRVMGSYPFSVAKQVGIHAEYANLIHLVKDKLSLLAHSIERERVKQIEAIRKCTTPKPLYVPVKTEKEKPLLLDIGYPHLDVGSRTRVTNTRDTFLDEMNMSKEEVVFKIHTKGYFEYDPLRCLDHIMSEIDEPKWALFYRIPKKSLEKGLKLLHTDNDVHSFFDADVKNGFIHLYVAHKKQNLGKYYYKNMEWEEEDAGLRCSNSTLFTTRFKRNIIKSNMIGLRKKVKTCVIHDDGADRKRKKTLVNGRNKGKEKVFEDEDTDKRQRKLWLIDRDMVNGKAKMVEDVGDVKTGRDTSVVIRDGSFNNVRGKEEVVESE